MGKNPKVFLKGLPFFAVALFLCLAPAAARAQDYGDAYVSGSIRLKQRLCPAL